MTAERWRQIETLFVQAAECPAAERSAFLDRVCNGDEELRRELASLLACDTPDEALVEIPAGVGEELLAELDPNAGMVDRKIGPYRLIRLIGHGGMGAVYLGVRADDQYQKQVAIKLLKRGMDTDFMLSRFRQERQILANLEHPFIARLLDGGATEDGLPYFVMEYVEGVPITKYCAEKNLSIPERLRLFRLVCEAVQHAHRNLVVHRDIKPSNILTTEEGVPKLLDFGIAKVVDPSVATEVTLTQRELRMLTPDYASPEQVQGLPISTASDIYSLGAVLYELLTGQRPHRLTSDSPLEIHKAICEAELEKPSSAVARNTDVPESLRRQSKRQLAGDLDNILIAAMRKEPQRRYASAAEFSEDVRRHLDGLPVMAQGDEWGYRAGKFIRRNRLAVGAGLLVAASLIGGIVATTIQARRAERRFQVVRELANSVSFDLYDQVAQLPGSTAAQAAMVQTVARYLDRLAEDSAGDPRLDMEIAKTYTRVATVEGHPFRSSLGRTAVALVHYSKAIEILERLVRRDETKAEALTGLMRAHTEAASVEMVLGHPGAAEGHLQKVAAIAEQAAPDTVPEARILAPLYLDLGSLASDRGDSETELARKSTAVEISRKWVEKDPSLNALTTLRNSYSQLASARAHAGDLIGARDTFLTALGVAQQLLKRPDASDNTRAGIIGIHHLYGDVLGAADDPNLDQPAAALAQYRAAAAINESLVAKDAKDVNPRRNLAGSYRRIGLTLMAQHPEESLHFYRKAVAISEELSQSEPQNVHYRSALADGLIGVGQALHRLGKNAEALQILDRTIELQKTVEAAAPDQVWLRRTTSRAYLAEGNVLLAKGDPEGALQKYREGFTVADKCLARFPQSLSLQLDRAELLEAVGSYYATLAIGSNQAARRQEWKTEARTSYGKSLAVWREWEGRKVADPYAGRRRSRTEAAMASLDRL